MVSLADTELSRSTARDHHRRWNNANCGTDRMGKMSRDGVVSTGCTFNFDPE